ncbi:ABC transporter permease subunit [Shinella curvata]|uniref:ABC transporter permease subunit n=1 Tax=Shinella curvata TaxID=1817964 RepID=A0ABT8XMB2_9HYPH|nr:ABC transporter permease subunit [Shinella curvata]MCJ8056759.1 ABC transporter permease subunit [Shinella curvata]MDO6124876.1 ABC transporter permease subunit [Shinella curvata]
MAFQPADTATLSTALPARRSAGKASVLHFADQLVGPLRFSAQPRRFLLLYLLADGAAVWLAMQELFVAMLVVFSLSRCTVVALVHLAGPEAKLRREAVAARRPWVEVLLYIFSLATIVLANMTGPIAAQLSTFPSSQFTRVTAAASIDATVTYLTVHGDVFFRIVTRWLLALLKGLESVLTLSPWPVIFAVVGFAAWKRGGAGLLVLVWMALGYLGLFGYWSEALQTSALVLASLCVCVAIGIPAGILLAKSPASRAIASPVLDLMQTMPSFVYLLPAVAFFSIGKPPALIATVIFALPPLVRLTCLGIEQVPLHVREAMQAHGATPLQMLLKAELPLALPSIRTGINQTIMMCLSMVVVAALIGGGGLGYNVLFALQNVQYGEGILAGLAIVFCAVLFDRLAGSGRKTDF